MIDSLQIGKISDAAFELPENGDSDEKLSDPYRTSDGWFLIRLDEVEDSLPLTFEASKGPSHRGSKEKDGSRANDQGSKRTLWTSSLRKSKRASPSRTQPKD